MSAIARSILWSALALVALAAPVSLTGCGGSGGGGGSGGTASSGVGAAMPSSLRLVGFDRRALSPSASGRVTLLVERPASASPQSFSLEESADGVSFFATGQAPTLVLPAALLYELPLPAAPRWYRFAAPAPSNTVAVDPAALAAAAGGAQSPVLASPPAGSGGVSKRPTVSVAGGAGAQSFLYAIADERGTLVWLAESQSPSLAPGDAGARTFIATGGLVGSSGHVATVIGLDADGFGAASGAAPRADFTTAP